MYIFNRSPDTLYSADHLIQHLKIIDIQCLITVDVGDLQQIRVCDGVASSQVFIESLHVDGVRFSDRATGNTAKYATGAKLIQLDVDLSEINKNIQVDVGLVGDIKSSFARISERCEKAEHKQWEQEIAALKTEEKRIIDEAEEASNGAMTPKKIFDVINKVKDKSTIIATDVGQHQMWAAQYTDFEQKRRFWRACK